MTNLRTDAQFDLKGREISISKAVVAKKDMFQGSDG
jgi:hypothetical protein